MKQIFLSVCLVTYNHEKFIRQVIEGVLMQETSFAFELVIGEDCSPDNTRTICEEYEKDYSDIIKLLPSETNLGLKKNFLRTFKECKGKYIAYLEGDDYWIMKDKLQKQVDILENNVDVSLVHTNCKIWDVKLDLFHDRQILFNKNVCEREINFGISSIIAEFEGHFRPMKTSTCCYRKELMDEILQEDIFAFSNPEFPTQDFQLFQEMSVRGRFAFIDEDTTVIGLHESLSASENIKKRNQFSLGFFKIGLYYIDKYKLPQQTINVWMNKQTSAFADYAFQCDNRESLRFVLRESKKRRYKFPLKRRILYYFLVNKCFNKLYLFLNN